MSEHEQTPTSVTVLGQASDFAAPDEARCVLAVSGLHGTVAAAVEDVSARAAALSELLVELGVSSHDRLTSAVTVEEQVEHRDGSAVVTAQRATVTVDVRLRDVTLLGRLLREAAERGRAQVLATRWVIDGGNPANAAVRTAAAADRSRHAGGAGARGRRARCHAAAAGRHAAVGGAGTGRGRRARVDGRAARPLRPRGLTGWRPPDRVSRCV
jgi:uncharacterized protein YggE